MTRNDLPPFISELARQLRRRRLSLGIYDYDALRQALLAGFGLSSRDELCRLCVALWAKSPEEIEIIRAVFNRGTIVDWNTAELSRAGIEIAEDGPRQADDGPVLPDHHADQGPLQAVRSATSLVRPRRPVSPTAASSWQPSTRLAIVRLPRRGAACGAHFEPGPRSSWMSPRPCSSTAGSAYPPSRSSCQEGETRRNYCC